MNDWRCPECGAPNGPGMAWCRTCSEPRPVRHEPTVGRWVRLYVDSEKEWFWRRAKDFKIWSWLLMHAAWRDTATADGGAIPRGSLLVSVASIAYHCQTTEQTVKTCLEKLRAGGKITSTSNNRGTMITITDYGTYEPNGVTGSPAESSTQLDNGHLHARVRPDGDDAQTSAATLTNSTTGGSGNGYTQS